MVYYVSRQAQDHTDMQVIKELLQQIFATPKGHQKSKPFFDHVISFSYCDNRIWLRNYQVVVALDKKKVKHEGVTLIEVGPRVSLQPIKVRSQHD
jgi:ribosome biogenesis protein BRX1